LDVQSPENYKKPFLTELSSNIQADNPDQPETKGIDLSEALPNTQDNNETAVLQAVNNQKENSVKPAESSTNQNQPTENDKNNTFASQPQLEIAKTVVAAKAETPDVPKPAPIVDAYLEEPQIKEQKPQKTPAEPKTNAANVINPGNKETPPGILSLAASGMGAFKNNNSAEILTNKFNLTETQSLTNGVKPEMVSALKDPNSGSSHLEQLLAANNPQTPVLNNTATAVQPQKANFNPLPDDVAQNMNRQIQESIQSFTRQGQDQVIIRLNPPELGKVVIKFHEQDNQIIGTLEASKPQTRYEIEQALPSILRNLQESGVQIRRLEVISEQNNTQYANKEQTLFDGWNGQNKSANYSNRGNQGDSSYYNDWMPDTDIYSATSPAQDLFYAESGVNMLA
ncbi:MAG: flagellar hook-length control protein FliK, partial [Candidatus Brocadiia bacterium]